MLTPAFYYLLMEMHKQGTVSQNQRYCTNIEKAQKGMATQTVDFYADIKLLFLGASILDLIEQHNNIMLY